jgi:hypothetical protein
MPTLDVNSWRQTGIFHFWRFTENVKNFPGWHLAFDPSGHASFLDLLTRLRGATESNPSRTVQLRPPSAEVLSTVNNRRSPVVSPTRVRVSRSDVANQWTIAEREADVSVAIGVKNLDGIIRWLGEPAAAFDTTYGEDPPLWFWGRAGTTRPGDRRGDAGESGSRR